MTKTYYFQLGSDLSGTVYAETNVVRVFPWIQASLYLGNTDKAVAQGISTRLSEFGNVSEIYISTNDMDILLSKGAKLRRARLEPERLERIIDMVAAGNPDITIQRAEPQRAA